jgi:hypothetical protein
LETAAMSAANRRRPTMARFLFVFRGGGFVEKGLSPADLGAHLQKWTDWLAELSKKGHQRDGGHPLQNAGKTVRGGAKAVTDGPFAEAKDMVTGTLIVSADSLEAATTLALGCPVFEFGGSVEVRPILEHER